jgi:hypothetical protein
MVWLVMIGLAAYRLARGRRSILRVLGVAGLLALVAEVVEGFSLDSFALPQLWIMLGLVTAGIVVSGLDPRFRGGDTEGGTSFPRIALRIPKGKR